MAKIEVVSFKWKAENDAIKRMKWLRSRKYKVRKFEDVGNKVIWVAYSKSQFTAAQAKKVISAESEETDEEEGEEVEDWDEEDEPEENPKTLVREATPEELGKWIKKNKLIMGIGRHNAVFISKSTIHIGTHRKIKDPKKFIDTCHKHGYEVVTDGKVVRLWVKVWFKEFHKHGHLMTPKHNIEVSASAPGGIGFKVATSEADIKGAESLHKMSKADQAETEKKMKAAGKRMEAFKFPKINPITSGADFLKWWSQALTLGLIRYDGKILEKPDKKRFLDWWVHGWTLGILKVSDPAGIEKWENIKDYLVRGLTLGIGATEKGRTSVIANPWNKVVGIGESYYTKGQYLVGQSLKNNMWGIYIVQEVRSKKANIKSVKGKFFKTSERAMKWAEKNLKPSDNPTPREEIRGLLRMPADELAHKLKISYKAAKKLQEQLGKI